MGWSGEREREIKEEEKEEEGKLRCSLSSPKFTSQSVTTLLPEGTMSMR